MLVISYERDVRHKSYWWDVFHLEQHFALNDLPTSPGKGRQLIQTRIRGQTGKTGIAYISTAYSTFTPHSILFQVVFDQRFLGCDILN